MAVVLQIVNFEWELQQCLVYLQLLAKSMTGEEIARELISMLSVQYSVSSNFLLSAMRDRACLQHCSTDPEGGLSKCS